MLEQLFEQPNQDLFEVESNADHNTRNSKRRKIEIISSHDVDDEDTVYYANAGKKQKGGIGYDGDASEDVSPLTLSAFLQSLISNSRLVVS